MFREEIAIRAPPKWISSDFVTPPQMMSSFNLLLFLPVLFGNFFTKLPKKLITRILRIRRKMNNTTRWCWRTRRFPPSGFSYRNSHQSKTIYELPSQQECDPSRPRQVTLWFYLAPIQANEHRHKRVKDHK